MNLKLNNSKEEKKKTRRWTPTGYSDGPTVKLPRATQDFWQLRHGKKWSDRRERHVRTRWYDTRSLNSNDSYRTKSLSRFHAGGLFQSRPGTIYQLRWCTLHVQIGPGLDHMDLTVKIKTSRSTLHWNIDMMITTEVIFRSTPPRSKQYLQKSKQWPWYARILHTHVFSWQSIDLAWACIATWNNGFTTSALPILSMLSLSLVENARLLYHSQTLPLVQWLPVRMVSFAAQWFHHSHCGSTYKGKYSSHEERSIYRTR